MTWSLRLDWTVGLESFERIIFRNSSVFGFWGLRSLFMGCSSCGTDSLFVRGSLASVQAITSFSSNGFSLIQGTSFVQEDTIFGGVCCSPSSLHHLFNATL
jgi:hypothetical protein